MDFLSAYRRSLAEFTDRVSQVRNDLWTAQTPCPEWDVRALVNHVVGEDRWTVPLMGGATIADVGDRLDGDVLGVEPIDAAHNAAHAADAVMSEPGALDRVVQLSSGPTPALEYGEQLLANHLIHAWDLAVAIGAEPALDEHAVRHCAQWFANAEGIYRSAGTVGPRVPLPDSADEQDRLLAAFGRDPDWVPA